MNRRRGRQRRAIQSLLYCAGWFAVLQTGLLLSLEQRGLEAFDPDFRDRLRLLAERRRESPDRPLCLVLGSSRVDMGFAPEILPEGKADDRQVLFFNFCHNGAGPLMQWLLWQRLRQEHIRPDWLVLEVMPPYLCKENNHFFTSIVPAADMPLAARHVPIWQLAHYGLRRRTDLIPRHCHDLLRRHAGLDLGGPELLGSTPRLPLGGHAQLAETVNAPDRQRKTAAQHAVYTRDLARFAISPRSDRVLRELLAECARDGIDVTLLVTPEGRTFRSLYRRGSDAVLADYLTCLRRDTGVSILNARDWLGEDDFLDSHHPTRDGALKFTLRLHRELLQSFAPSPLISSR